MSSVKTRRQASLPKSANQEDVQVVVNGVHSEDDYPRENIFMFIPNLIGYSRIFLAFASLYYMPLHPRTCSLLYSISCLLDALDGYAARYYEQSTKFGAVLDMVTDRCTTTCLLVFLAAAWPRLALPFQALISLDLASHYIHMYATLVMAGTDTSHKAVDKDQSWLLHLYYTKKSVLFWTCALNEVCFIALYLLSFSSPILSPSLLQSSSSGAQSLQPGNPSTVAASTLFSSPWSAGALELARANKMDSTVPWILFVCSSPVMIFKQVLNVVQLVSACKWLAEGDVQNRKKAGLPRRTKTN